MNSNITLEDELKLFGTDRGAEQVGIASVADINRYAPPGHRPDDILIGAKSVIVLAGYMLFHGAWRSPNYQTHYFNKDFSRIHTGIAKDMAKFIESKHGYYSLGKIPPTIGFYPSLSQKLCAEMAGIGTRSMAGGVLLNEKLGIFNIATCVTAMSLTADSRMEESVCPHPSCTKMWEKKKTTPCLEACPECLSGELEGGRIKWMKYDRRVCSIRTHTLSSIALQRMLLQTASESNPAIRRSILLGSFSRSMVGAVASGETFGPCIECVRHCPICINARNFKAKVLTNNSQSQETLNY